MSRLRGSGIRGVTAGITGVIVDAVVIAVALLVVSLGCAERSRPGRCAAVAVVVAAMGWLAVRYLRPPHAVPVLAAYGVLAVAVEWRRSVPGEGR